MAPLKPVRKDGADKRVQAILEFAKKTCELLNSRRQLPSNTEVEIRALIKRSFPLPSSAVLAGNSIVPDSLGTELWNAATKIIREDDVHQVPQIRRDDATRLAVSLRVFAFFLIDSAFHASSRRARDQDQWIRIFKIALKACRFCLEKGELQLALKVLERCSELVVTPEEESHTVHLTRPTEDSDSPNVMNVLVSEFYLLRMTHAWKSDRLDLAEHFFNKLSVSRLAESPSLAEKAAEVFGEAGKSLSKKKLIEDAIKWSGRALNALDACDPEHLSQDADELRLSITTNLVQALLSSQTKDSIDRAGDLVRRLYSNHGLGTRMAVQGLQLSVAFAIQPANVQVMNDVLLRMIRSVVLTDHTFKTVMQWIHRTRHVNLEIAYRGLEQLIGARLLPDLTANTATEGTSQLHIEKSCVTYTLFATSDLTSARSSIIAGLQNIFDAIVQRNDNGLSAKATHACQALMWKAAGTADQDIGDRWYGLLRHPLFNGAGQINKARIGRKAMMMGIAKNDLNGAREAFYQLPVEAQNDNITRYLTFKLALRSNDYELANDSLKAIMKQADRDATFLYACVLEAQSSEMQHMAVAALQAILDKQPAGIHLPSLLRCTARLLIGELDAQDRSQDDVMEEVVRVFENASINVKALQHGTEQQATAELQWWSKNAYNLSLRLCESIRPDHLVRLLSVCTRLLSHFPIDSGSVDEADVSRRKSICHFLSASVLIVLARSSEEGSENGKQYYLQARSHISAFRSIELRPASAQDNVKFSRRRFELLKFDVECILRLQQWDKVDAILKVCLDCEDVDRWDTLADLVLVLYGQVGSAEFSDCCNGKIAELLERIINSTWKKEKDVVKASRWLRLAFTMSLSDGRDEFALKLLEQGAGMAKKGYDRSGEPFPDNELQWLATTAFNKAVDMLSSGQGNGCRVWIDSALELARHAADNGALHAALTSKREQVVERIKSGS